MRLVEEISRGNYDRPIAEVQDTLKQKHDIPVSEPSSKRMRHDLGETLGPVSETMRLVEEISLENCDLPVAEVQDTLKQKHDIPVSEPSSKRMRHDMGETVGPVSETMRLVEEISRGNYDRPIAEVQDTLKQKHDIPVSEPSSKRMRHDLGETLGPVSETMRLVEEISQGNYDRPIAEVQDTLKQKHDIPVSEPSSKRMRHDLGETLGPVSETMRLVEEISRGNCDLPVAEVQDTLKQKHDIPVSEPSIKRMRHDMGETLGPVSETMRLVEEISLGNYDLPVPEVQDTLKQKHDIPVSEPSSKRMRHDLGETLGAVRYCIMPSASMDQPRFYGRRNPLASAVPVKQKKREAAAVSKSRLKRQAMAKKENVLLIPKAKGFHRRKPYYVKKIYCKVLCTQDKWQPTHRTHTPLPHIRLDDSAAAVPEIFSPSSPPPSSPFPTDDASASEIHGSLAPLLLDDSASRPEISIRL
ncbi:uncharacterized protein LOC142465264 [Ascaphus truei]|uniref:uncharacterized protein LOC142465264 n=1 Tax=Ascaphus truei TaxID=8439 RepID=UPI003F5A5FCA